MLGFWWAWPCLSGAPGSWAAPAASHASEVRVARTPAPDEMSAPEKAADPLLRRLPRQRRALERIDQLLDAAAAVIAEVGVGETTTNAIAARAGASVGSLYQFFPNKDAVLRSLAMRYASTFDVLKGRVMAVEAADLPLETMMRGIVEPMAAFFDANPAYPRLFAAMMETDDAVASVDARMHDAVIARVEAMLARRYPAMRRSQRHAVATVQVHTVHAIMIASLHCADRDRRAMREELVRTLVAALAPFDRTLRSPAHGDDRP
jgi:AcrR family transcriptional regulator